MKIQTVLMAVCLFLQIASFAETKTPSTWHVYIGTYTGGESEGIYLVEMDATTGALSPRNLAVKVENPSFIAAHPGKQYLYSVGQGTGAAGHQEGLVSAFTIHPEDGHLTLLNQQPTRGSGPCHIIVDRTGRHVLVANYGSGSVNVLPVKEDGALEGVCDYKQHTGANVNPQRQEGPHAHSVTLDPSGSFLFAADLGLDKIMIYRYDGVSGRLKTNDPSFAKLPPGAGPRHFAFHPSGNFAYVVNELNNTVTVFEYDQAKGRLDPIQTLGTLPNTYTGNNTTAEIRVHPSGRFVYASNRGHDSIACFSVEESTGRLNCLGQTPTAGKVPRNFNISPDGRFLLAANQESSTIVAFPIDTNTGIPGTASSSADVPAPVCVLFSAP